MAESDDLAELKAWKAEALAVLSEWEKVWEATGRPGRIGTTKAGGVLAWVLNPEPSDAEVATACDAMDRIAGWRFLRKCSGQSSLWMDRVRGAVVRAVLRAGREVRNRG